MAAKDCLDLRLQKRPRHRLFLEFLQQHLNRKAHRHFSGLLRHRRGASAHSRQGDCLEVKIRNKPMEAVFLEVHQIPYRALAEASLDLNSHSSRPPICSVVHSNRSLREGLGFSDPPLDRHKINNPATASLDLPAIRISDHCCKSIPIMISLDSETKSQ